ncbi:conserved hypothetical protein [Talaromyces stipitatus ATCC 10500]|uniref:Cytochrome P450 n=1 Tax=Talaromyces stipitatus (strain ATCC 10500 / CBS 375.48 / QM 6759 / NRRL 1006) TaxID=441959 RepID=B8M883_TALSN|nr:uncharacterized protein TSTA_036220 [Talaromyces stipitatus ATCC 10500]EED20396.1 conserved hypothetical protein [Talaromyces stipitatus ATCC 10500]
MDQQHMGDSSMAQLLESSRQVSRLTTFESLPILSCLLLISAAIIVWKIWQNALDPREPRLAPASVPIIGHIVGFAMHSLQYLNILRTRTGLGAYTMRIGTYKLYVICSPTLAQAALRSPDLSADLLVPKAAPQLMNLSPHVTKILKQGDFARNNHTAFTEKLSLNPSLSKTERAILDGIATLLNDLRNVTEVPDLLRWLSSGMVLNNSTALYGTGNPVAENPKLIEDMW